MSISLRSIALCILPSVMWYLALFTSLKTIIASKPLDATNHDHPMQESRDYKPGPEEVFTQQLTGLDLKGLEHTMKMFSAMDNSGGLGLSLGGEKSSLIGDVVKSFISSMGGDVKSVHVLELGSHMGDGTLSLLNGVKAIPGSSVTSIEEDPHWHSLGSTIVRTALRSEPGHEISYLPLQMPNTLQDLTDSLQDTHGVMKIHVVMMDHGDHTGFRDVIEHLLGSNMLAPGAKIISDNALTKKNAKSDYLDLVDNSRSFKTELHDITIPYRDQVHVATFIGHDEL
jgi:predicted O-methyltransferase YrrM